jgi:hypothetical protein
MHFGAITAANTSSANTDADTCSANTVDDRNTENANANTADNHHSTDNANANNTSGHFEIDPNSNSPTLNTISTVVANLDGHNADAN